MPPTRSDTQSTQHALRIYTSVASLKKPELIQLANHFNLNSDRLSAFHLRNLINDHLDHNYSPGHPQYGRLFGRRLWQRRPHEDVEKSKQAIPPPQSSTRLPPSLETSLTLVDDHESPRSWDKPKDQLPRDLALGCTSSDYHSHELIPRSSNSQFVRDWVKTQIQIFSPGPQTDEGRQMNGTSPTTIAFHHARPKRDIGSLSTGAGYLIPVAVRHVFMNGWNYHVPLNYLTDRYCDYKNLARQESLRLDPSTAQLSESPKKPPCNDDELSLTFEEWLQAWTRLLDLITTSLPHELDLWKVHYERILHSETRTIHWPLWLAYDIEIRQRCTALPIDPSQYHVEVWDDVKLQYIRKNAQRRTEPINLGATSTSHPSLSQPRPRISELRDVPAIETLK